MELNVEYAEENRSRFRNLLHKLWEPYKQVPLLGWLLAALVAVLLEMFVGQPLARLLGMSKIPALFGVILVLKTPILIPSTLLYLLLIYGLPIAITARLTAKLADFIAEKLYNTSTGLSLLLHIALLYAVLHLWTSISDYRLLIVKLTLISIIITLSLNMISRKVVEKYREVYD